MVYGAKTSIIPYPTARARHAAARPHACSATSQLVAVPTEGGLCSRKGAGDEEQLDLDRWAAVLEEPARRGKKRTISPAGLVWVHRTFASSTARAGE